MKYKKLITTILVLFLISFSNAQDKNTLQKAQQLFDNHQLKEAREVLLKIPINAIADEVLYDYHFLLKRTAKNTISVQHELNSFLDEYATQKSWNTTALSYKRQFGKHTVIGRMNYSDRFTDNAFLYEIEAYPVLSKRFYAWINVSFSTAESFYQKIGSVFTLYYNVGNGFEIEGGYKYLEFQNNSFSVASIGVSKYYKNFLFNIRSNLGPEVEDKLFQNYQLNTRYYLKNGEDYVFVRLGTGISPDDTNRFTIVNQRTDLKAFYGTLGVQKWFKNFQIEASTGVLTEELPNNDSGNQLLANIGLAYRF